MAKKSVIANADHETATALQGGEAEQKLQTTVLTSVPDEGDIHGVWTRSTRDAMVRFTELVNAKLPTNEADIILLSLVRGYAGTTRCGQSVITAAAPNVAPSLRAPALDGIWRSPVHQSKHQCPVLHLTVGIPARRTDKQGRGIGWRNFGGTRPTERANIEAGEREVRGRILRFELPWHGNIAGINSLHNWGHSLVQVPPAASARALLA